MVYFHVPFLSNFTGRLCIIQCLLVIYNWVSIIGCLLAKSLPGVNRQ